MLVIQTVMDNDDCQALQSTTQKRWSVQRLATMVGRNY